MRASTLMTVASMTALCAVTMLSAVVESFLVPYELLPAVSVASLLAIVGNLVITRAGRRTAAASWGAFVPAVLWLLVVVVLGMQRPEGDLVVPGTAGGLLFMLSGTLASVVGIATHARPDSTSPNGLSA